MTLAERLSPISLFRWRLEWALLALIAACVVLGEQAREQRSKAPYTIVQSGLSATATVRRGRAELYTLSPRWMRNRQEMRTFLDLEWLDRDGKRRIAESYLLDGETIAALRIDPSSAPWPERIQILYLDEPAATAAAVAGPASQAYQPDCRPRPNCRVLVLAPGAKNQAELDADLADSLAVWAPRGLWGGILGLLVMLALRWAGLVHNRPSLE